jgi:hypothetical protein
VVLVVPAACFSCFLRIFSSAANCTYQFCSILSLFFKECIVYELETNWLHVLDNQKSFGRCMDLPQFLVELTPL